MRPGALIITQHYASVLNRRARMDHERFVSGKESSVTGELKEELASPCVWPNRLQRWKLDCGLIDPQSPVMRATGDKARFDSVRQDQAQGDASASLAMTDEEPAQGSLSRDPNKTGPENSGGGTSISGPRVPEGHQGAVELCNGGSSCSVVYLSESQVRRKSTDKNCSIPTELSDGQNSFLSPESYGFRPTPLRSSPSSAARVSEPLSDGSRERFARPTASSRQPITSSSAAIADFNTIALELVLSEMRKNICGND